MDASDTAKEEQKDGEENIHKNEMLKPRMRRSEAINFDDGESNVNIKKIVETIKNENEWGKEKDIQLKSLVKISGAPVNGDSHSVNKNNSFSERNL